MIGESYLLGARNTPLVQSTVYLMIFGAMIAGIYDFDYSAIGYFLVAWNCVFTAAYLLYISKLGKSSGLNTFGLMWYNNVQSLPIVIGICWLNGDFAEVASYPFLWDWDFLLCFVFQSALAFLLNYSIFLCTNVNSALATSVTGQIKNIATTAVGYFTFGDVTYNFLNVLGLLIGVVASSWYSLLKFWESEAAKSKTLLPSAATPCGSTKLDLLAASPNGAKRSSSDEEQEDNERVELVAKGPSSLGFGTAPVARG
jgi:solute carrier family 35 protein